MVVEINKVLKNFISNGVSNILSQFLSFLLIAYTARVLGPEIYGNVTTVQAIMLYFTMVVMLGLQSYGTREVAKDRDSVGEIVGEILFIRLIVTAVCIAVIYIISILLHSDKSFSSLLLLYGLTLIPAALNIDWVFQGIQEMQYNAVYNITRSLIPLLLVQFFLKKGSEAYLLPVFTLIGMSVGVIFQALIYFNKFRFRLNVNIKNARKYLIYGFPFMISGILATINCNVDRIVIKFSRGSIEAGIYSTGYNIVLFLTNIVTIIFVPIFPVLIEYFHNNNYAKLVSLRKNILKIISIISLPICVGGIILSKEIIVLAFGKKYESAYFSFSILMLYILILFIREVFGYSLNAWNLERKYLVIVAISSAFNLIFNLVFTPRYGMNIAALITVLSEVINLILMKHYSDKIIRVQELGYLSKGILPTACMALVVFYLRFLGVNVIINILVAMIVYFISIIVLKVISIDEIKAMIKKENIL